MSKKSLDKTTAELVVKFKSQIDKGGISTARQADEVAAELAGDSGFAPDSEEFEHVISALFEVAGKEFPGDWGDYKAK
ncbi:MAG: hypothetical protein ACLQF0_06695 [Dissulfurispiraceae bacterium]